jgi:hypothetical protein
VLRRGREFVNVAGVWWHGRDEIERRHAERHPGPFKQTVLDSEVAAFKEVAPNVGVVHLTWTLETPAGTRLGVQSLTVRDRGAKLEIVAAHNTDARES